MQGWAWLCQEGSGASRADCQVPQPIFVLSGLFSMESTAAALVGRSGLGCNPEHSQAGRALQEPRDAGRGGWAVLLR